MFFLKGLSFVCILNLHRAADVVSNFDELDELSFTSFIQLHNRQYKEGEAEYAKRKALFESRLLKIKSHNSRKDRLWTARVNKFGDWTENELATLRGWRGHASRRKWNTQSPRASLLQENQATLIPPEKSWTHLKISDRDQVRDQGSCGSCWAVAASSLLEAYHQIVHERFRTFSPQELVSCVQNPHHCGGTGGCEGATIELAFDYVMKNGLGTEEEEPYQAVTSNCDRVRNWQGGSFLERRIYGSGTDHSAAKFGMRSWNTLPENEYEPVLLALQDGPVGSSVAAKEWFSYNDGVYNGCGADAEIDHAVVILGYGVEDKTKYWIIQNSWGPDWGEHGKIRLLRQDNDADTCGTDYAPEEGTGCEGGPSNVTVCGMCGVLYDNTIARFQRI